MQLAAAVDFGATVSGYIWCYWGVDASEHVAEALGVADGYNLTTVWFDAEDNDDAYPGTVIPWLHRADNAALSRGFDVGMYTGRYWWEEYAGNSEEFADLPLWLADYNDDASLSFPHPFGGWTVLAGHQYTSEPTDISVFDSQYT